MRPQLFPTGECCRQIITINNGNAEAARRHCVLLRRAVFVKRDLYTGDAGNVFDLLDKHRWRMTVAPAIRTEQHDAITFASVVVEIPLPGLVESNQRINPTRTIKIGPLVGETQVRFDNRAADGLEIEHASVAGKV